jgi:hypothetical protein
MGVGEDPGAQISDRDLWKYDRLVGQLDETLETDDGNALALVYRGNASYFRANGAADAERDYRAALALRPDDPAVRRNLERLQEERAASR